MSVTPSCVCRIIWYSVANFLRADPSGVGLRPLAYWDCGFESRREHGCLSVVSVVCCQVEVSASGWSLVQRSPTECDVSKKCDREASIMRRPRPPRGCRAIGEKILFKSVYEFITKTIFVISVMTVKHQGRWPLCPAAWNLVNLRTPSSETAIKCVVKQTTQ
jgi:hypothetical protein